MEYSELYVQRIRTLCKQRNISINKLATMSGLILLAGMLLVDWKLGLLVYGIAILVYALYYRNAMKYFGGTTGDLAGCFLSLCEVFMACGAVLGALWL